MRSARRRSGQRHGGDWAEAEEQGHRVEVMRRPDREAEGARGGREERKGREKKRLEFGLEDPIIEGFFFCTISNTGKWIS